MSDNLAVSGEPIKEPPGGRRHTIRWEPADWQRIEEAAERLSIVTAAEVSVPNLIRGATLRRVSEILDQQAA